MQDFLQVCMTDPALVQGQMPIDTFTKVCCLRCIQVDCSRSRMNESSMRIRSLNWKKDLFDEVPRASVNDSRFANMATKKFVPGRESISDPVYEIQSPVEEKEPLVEEELIKTSEVVSKTEKIEESEKLITKPVEAKLVENRIANTTFQQGTVLPGKQKDVILESGASYTFDSEDSDK